MKKIVGVALLSTLVLMSCQKKEQVSSIQAPQTQTPVIERKATPGTDQQPQPQMSMEEKPAQEPAKKSIDGKTLFASKGCSSCHQENTDTVGPSLKKIASTYQSDRTKLTAFLRGEGKPIVDPSKETIMKPQIEITKKMPQEELNAVVDYILEH
ncbi:MAG: c-type cytochrome [Hydrogenothermaceae bacterium]|nr:c-type cytochrome [Hydrogenothermaceae bacterium]